MKLINNFPATFFSRYPVHILDGKGKLFYFHPNEQGSIIFNLPCGKFLSLHPIEKGKNFTPYPCIPLPVFISKDMIPKNFITRVENNENKASIALSQNRVSVDNKIFNHDFAPVPVFVLGHEAGHHIFNKNPTTDEKHCDIFSYNLGMLSGYNPIQMKVAKEEVFKNNPDRKICLDYSIDFNTSRR